MRTKLDAKNLTKSELSLLPSTTFLTFLEALMSIIILGLLGKV
jgi:hypothetical protein